MEILMAWRNVWRNPRRTVLTIFAIAFACLLLVFMLSLQTGMYGVMINAAVKTRTGHLQVLVDGYNNDHKIRKIIEDPPGVGRLLNSINHVTGYTFRANGFALLSSEHRTYGGLITGIDPVRESKISTIAATIRKGAFLTPQDSNAAIIGTLLAKNLKIDVGDELTPGLLQSIQMDLGGGIIFYGILLVMVAFSIMNTFLMTVFERTREFGLLKALGMKPLWIVRNVLSECLILLILGLFAGNLFGFATIRSLAGGIDMSFLAQGSEFFGMGHIVVRFLTVKDVLAVNAVILTLGLLVCLYPAVKAGRITPVEAMTHI